MSYLLVYGSGEPIGLVLGLACGGLGFCTGVASLLLGMFGPARYPLTAAAILGSLGAILLLLSVVPSLEIR